MTRLFGFVAGLLALLLLLPSPGQAQTSASIALHWLPQAQFAGIYMAKKKGFYAKRGINMTIRAGGPDHMSSEELDKGSAMFATMFLGAAMERRAAGLPLLNIGQIVQRSALMLVGKRSAGIKSIKDLDGRKVSLWAGEFQLQPRLLFDRENLDVTIVPQGASMALFLRDAVAASSVMLYNEYHTLLMSGLDKGDMLSIPFSDLGFNFPEDGIYVLESTFAKNPKLCADVVAATLEGWKYAFAHEEETLKHVLKIMADARIPSNAEHQRWMFERMREIILPDSPLFGILAQADYMRVANALKKFNFIPDVVPYKQFYKGGE